MSISHTTSPTRGCSKRRQSCGEFGRRFRARRSGLECTQCRDSGHDVRGHQRTRCGLPQRNGNRLSRSDLHKRLVAHQFEVNYLLLSWRNHSVDVDRLRIIGDIRPNICLLSTIEHTGAGVYLRVINCHRPDILNRNFHDVWLPRRHRDCFRRCYGDLRSILKLAQLHIRVRGPRRRASGDRRYCCEPDQWVVQRVSCRGRSRGRSCWWGVFALLGSPTEDCYAETGRPSNALMLPRPLARRPARG